MMTLPTLLLVIHKAGIKPTVKAGKLALTGSKKALTPQMMEAFRYHKLALMKRFAAAEPLEDDELCRIMEKYHGLPIGSIALYTPEDFLRLGYGNETC